LPIARVIRSVISSVISRVASPKGCDYHPQMTPPALTRFVRRAASSCCGTRR